MDNSKDRDFKGFFWGYIVIAFVAIFGGAFSVYSRINGVAPFLFSLDPNPGPVVTESQTRLQELAAKKLLDSDGDTISDFDEEYSFSTSAYLSDSDSDGLSDSEEINAGSNPNCATGQTCFSAVSNSNSSNSANTSISTADIATLSTDDPVQFRQELVALGIDQAVLDQISDADLLSVYGSVQQQYGNTNTASSNTNNTVADPYAELLPATNTTYDNLQNLSPEAVRDLLVQSGMSAEDLAQIDDATLMQVYEDTLAENAQ